MLGKGRFFILCLLTVGALRASLVAPSNSTTSASEKANSSSKTIKGTQSARYIRPPKVVPQHIQAEALLQYSQHRYEEKDVSIEGPMWGAYGSLMLPVYSGLAFGARGEFMTGDTTYNGQYFDLNNTGVNTKVSGPSKDEFYDVAGIGAVEIFNQSPNTASIFLGLALRNSFNHVKLNGGYSREISHFYFPIGVKGQVGLSRDWKLRAEGEFDILLSGQTTSHLAELGSNYSDTTHTQDRGFGFRAYLRAQYVLPTVSLLLGPYYSYWKVEDSNSVASNFNGQEKYLMEPQNTTTRFGVTLGILY